MNDGFDVRSLAIDFQVQLDFAGSSFRSRDLLRIHVDDAKIIDSHETFAGHRGGAQDAIFI